MALKNNSQHQKAARRQINLMLDNMQTQAEDIFEPFVVYLRNQRLFYTGNSDLDENRENEFAFTFRREDGSHETRVYPKPNFYALNNDSDDFDFRDAGRAATRDEAASALLSFFIKNGLDVDEARMACVSAEKLKHAVYSVSREKFEEDGR